MYFSHARNARSIALAFFLSAVANAVVPNDALPLESDNKLQSVVVTATRTAEPQDRTLSSVTVVTRAQIESRQYQTLDQVLSDTTGVSISNNGGVGKASNFFIRGAESDQNLVLVNGLRVGSTTAGTASVQDIPLDQIERIEIVRGPRSAQYGADALGGVVQIFTRDAKSGDGLHPQVTLGFGSNNTRRSSVNLGHRDERSHWQFGLSQLESAGTNACEGYGFPRFAGCFTDQPDRDGYRNQSGSLRAGTTFGVSTRLDGFAMLTRGRVQYDGDFGDVANFTQNNFGLALTQPLAGKRQLRLQLGRATDDSENFSGSTSQGRFDTTRDTGSVLFDSPLSTNWQLSAGADVYIDRVASDTRYVKLDRRTVGAFAQTRWTHGAQDLLLSLRRDDNQQFGGKTTGSIAWGYDVAAAWRITASAGTGFKVPSFNELYYPDFGNPLLRPETSRSGEVSLRWRTATTRMTLTAYENRIDDLIGFDSNFAPVNIDRSRTRGIEAELQTQWRGWEFQFGAERLDPRSLGLGTAPDQQLPRRAREVLRVEIQHQFGRLSLGTNVRYNGARFDDLSNARRLGGYTNVNLQADWAVNSRWRVQAQATNLLGRAYSTAEFFPQPGRQLNLTLHYTPQMSNLR